MNTSSIQEVPNVVESRSTKISSTQRSTSDLESFKRMFESELSYDTKQRPGINSVDELTPEAQSSLGQAINDNGANSSPETGNNSNSEKGGQGNAQQSVSNDPSKNKSIHGESIDQTESENQQGVSHEKNRAGTKAGKETGKNVTMAKEDLNGEAKNAVRPSLPAGEKLTYGNVRKVENTMIGAGSAASSSIQTMNYHHGTPRASSVSRPKTESLNEGSIRSGTMTSNVMKHEAPSNLIHESEGSKMGLSSGLKPIVGVGVASSNASFGGGQFDDSGQFAGKENHALSEVQLSNKTQFVVPSSTSNMVDSVRKIQSMIQDQVMVLKTMNHQTMQVMIRPDTNTSLFLTLNQGDAEVIVAARMDSQTSNILKPHWAELQKELEQHGIQLGDPEGRFEQHSQRHQNGGSKEEQGSSYDSQSLFRHNRPTTEDHHEDKETNHEFDPDIENTQGALVSWA